MDLNKTLGIVGTPHEESIAKINPPKLVKSRGIEEIPPRTPLTLEHRNPKIEPLNSRIWEGNQRQKNHEGFPQIPPIKSPRASSRKHTKKTIKRGLRKSPPRTTGNNTTKP
jgi:hypothetical protein